MITSKKINIIVVTAICLSLIMMVLMIGLSNSDLAKDARSPKYINELFGEKVIEIEIVANENEWQEMLNNASAKEYIMADVIVNGVKYQNVGVRPKGNATLTQVAQTNSPERYSLRIKFDEYISDQTCMGLDVLILNNMVSDTTYMKEYLSQDLMRYIGVEAPLTNYANISVNGKGFGFYVALEAYNESYDSRVNEDTNTNYYNVKSGMGGGANRQNENFNEQNGNGQRDNQRPNVNGELADQNNFDNQGPNQQPNFNQGEENEFFNRENFGGMGGGGSGGSLEYTDDNLSSYSAIFDNSVGSVSESDQQKVVEALKVLSNNEKVEDYFDIDAILRYFAAHTVVVNLDSYYSNMAQNYFIAERDGIITILPWDYHLSYGGFQSSSTSEIVNFAIDTPVSGVTMESRPLLNYLLTNEKYLNKYHKYLQEIVDGYFNSGLFEQTVENLKNKISNYVKNDPTAFYTYEQFELGVETLVQLNLLRAESIEKQLAGIIPSTTSEQANSSLLVDASSINMSNLGSMGMGANRGNIQESNLGMENRPNNGNWDNFENGNEIANNNPFNDVNIDMELMQQAMQIIEQAGGEISEPIKQQLLELGLTQQQIEMLSSMPNNGAGNNQGGFNNQENNGQGGMAGQFGGGANQAQRPNNGQMWQNVAATNQNNWLQLGLTIGGLFLLSITTFIITKTKRNF